MSEEGDRTPYLVTHPPARSQFRTTRRAEPSGAIVVHTFEGGPDLDPPDGGAERGAAYISNRTNAPGSYHSLCDSDSTVQLGWYRWEMFGEGTGGNRWALHLSFYTRAAKWGQLPKWWIDAAIEQGAMEAARMARWVKSTQGVDVPARRISANAYGNRFPGFISHAEIEDARGTRGRRTDPGVRFPWNQFLERYAHHIEGDTMPPYPKADIREIQNQLSEAGFDIGPTGVDGILGPKTMSAFNSAMDALTNVDLLAQAKAKLLDRFAAGVAGVEQSELQLDKARKDIRDSYSI